MSARGSRLEGDCSLSEFNSLFQNQTKELLDGVLFVHLQHLPKKITLQLQLGAPLDVFRFFETKIAQFYPEVHF